MPEEVNNELVQRVTAAVKGELELLARELGVEGYGARFRDIVKEITLAAALSLGRGDESFSDVQKLIDEWRKAPKNSLPIKPYDENKKKSSVPRLRRSHPKRRMGARKYK